MRNDVTVTVEGLLALSLEVARQNIASQNLESPVGSGTVAERQGTFKSESVRPTADNSVLTKAAVEGSGVLTTARTNLRDLAERVQKEPAVTTASLYESLGELPELDKTALPGMFEFIDGLAELAGEEAGHEKVGEEQERGETGREESSEQAQGSLDESRINGSRGRNEREGGASYGHDHEEGRLGEEIDQALGKFKNNSDKATAIALARGFFEAKGASLNFLELLGKFAAEFEDVVSESALAQLAAAEEALLASATMETSPAAVRRRYRKRLRDGYNLGKLFEELVEIELEASFSALLSEVGADLANINQQSDSNHLRSVTSELKKLWQMKSAHDETKELCRITEPHLSKSRCVPNPLKLTTAVLYFCGKSSVGPGDTQLLLEMVALASIEGQVVFANSLRELHGRMPDGIWTATRDRLLQYTALGALCHRLTEAEERLYEEQAAN